MVAVDCASHKGYLRMGKLLRLLLDDRSALATYQMGMRRARTGLDEIRQQALKMELVRAAKAASCWDPFFLLPAEVGYRIARFLVDERSVKRAGVMSLASAWTLGSFLNLVRPVDLAEFKRVTSVESFLSPKQAISTIICSRDRFTVLLKALTKQKSSLHARRLVLRDVTIEAALLVPSPLLASLQQLELTDTKLHLSDLDRLLSLTTGLHSLKLRNVHLHSLEAASIRLGSLATLHMEHITGWAVASVADFVQEHLPGLRFLHWYDKEAIPFLANGFFSEAPMLVDLGVRAEFLDHIEASRILPCQVRSLKLVSDHLVDVHTASFERLSCFSSIRRLHLKGVVFKDRHVALGVSLEFPMLEHLFLDQLFPVPAIQSWRLVNMRTISIVECEMSAVNQLPTFGDRLEVLLISGRTQFLHADCFRRVLEQFSNGKLHVLGVKDACQFFRTNGGARISAVAQAQPLNHLLVSDVAISNCISAIWLYKAQ